MPGKKLSRNQVCPFHSQNSNQTSPKGHNKLQSHISLSHSLYLTLSHPRQLECFALEEELFNDLDNSL
ncbi:hypothetical protein LguiA_013846 [Lonicera macranthoides]